MQGWAESHLQAFLEVFGFGVHCSVSFLFIGPGVTLRLSCFSFLAFLQPGKGSGEHDCCDHLHWGCPGQGQPCAVDCDDPGGINLFLCQQMHQQDIPAGTLVGFWMCGGKCHWGFGTALSGAAARALCGLTQPTEGGCCVAAGPRSPQPDARAPLWSLLWPGSQLPLP